MSTYAPPVHVHHRPHIDVRLGVIVALVAALVALGSWVLVDRYAGGGGATHNATTLIDKFYTASSAHDTAAVKALWTSDGVMWTNGNRFSVSQLVDQIKGTAGLHVQRIAPVTVWGDFATTIMRFQVPFAGINGPMIEVVQMKDGKLFRAWDFAIGVTPPLTNTAAPK